MSLTVYTDLQSLYPNTLECPCSNVMMPYFTFTSLSHTLHQVCTSDFISDSWISMTKLIQSEKWFGMNSRHFLLLSNLCDITNRTMTDAVRSFSVRPFVTLSVLPKSKFNVEMNATLNKIFEELRANFYLLMNTSHLWTQTDAPFKLPDYNGDKYSVDSKFSVTANDSNVEQMPQVSGC